MTEYGNVGHDAERFAATVVRSWVGARGTVTDLGDTPEPDFRIDYADGQLGIGEVTTHTDPAIEAMWSAAFESGQPQQINLPTGLGTWVAGLVAGANIKRLTREVGVLIESVKAQGIERLTIYYKWPRGEPYDTARWLGIDYLQSHPSGSEDVLIYFMPSSGGSYDGDPDVVTDWIEDVLSSEHYRDVTQKLLDRNEADERHGFVVANSASSFAPAQAMTQLDQALPGRAPQLPDGITHAWAFLGSPTRNTLSLHCGTACAGQRSLCPPSDVGGSRRSNRSSCRSPESRTHSTRSSCMRSIFSAGDPHLPTCTLSHARRLGHGWLAPFPPLSPYRGEGSGHWWCRGGNRPAPCRRICTGPGPGRRKY